MDKRTTSRRDLFKHLFGTLGSAIAPFAVAADTDQPAHVYEIVDRRELADGGIGLFIAIPPGLSREWLKAFGERLRERFSVLPSVTIEVFDDVEAAKTVRSGFRVVGEQRFTAALAHQRASYFRNQRSGRHSFTIRDEPRETVNY